MASAPSGAAVLGVIYSLIALAALIIIARIYLRLVIQKQRLVAADWLRIAAWCSAFTTAAFDIVFLKEDVLDPTLNYTLVNWDAPPEKLERVLKYMWACVIPFFTTFYLCKASLLVVYLQLFPPFMKKRRIVVWTIYPPEDTCEGTVLERTFQIAWALHFIGSLFLFALPFLVLHKLNMRTRVKISVYCIFLLGLIDIAMSLTRFLTIQLGNVGDFRSITTIELWSALDAYIGLIIACLPALRPYLRRKGSKYEYPESGRPTGHSGVPPRRVGQSGFEELDETPSLEGDLVPRTWAGSNSPELGAGWSDKKSTRSDVELVTLDANKLAYCGLIGQVALGVAWGTPGAKWLSREVEDAVVQLGYLGLILLVFEGGLSTSFKSLKANLGLSSIVATTGILIPIGFSFAVMSMLNATPLQAFSAGAALCSTSLGTTFTILGTSGLSATRLGVVLTSAAMMDDVVGLIMVQVISNLGGDSFDVITVVRPVVVSLGFAVVIPILCREENPTSNVSKALSLRQTAFVIHTAYLLGIVVGATFAGTSSLLAAYIAGATISWWDSDVPHLEAQDANATDSHGTEESRPAESENIEESSAAPVDQRPLPTAMKGGSGAEVFHRYYEPALQRILKPFFFASIGFSVPIAKLFAGPIVWRGVIYTILMIIAKLACGLWLVSFTNPYRAFAQLVQRFSPKLGRSSKSLVPGTQCADTASTPQEDSTTKRVRQSNGISLEPTEGPSVTQNSPQVRNSTPNPEKSTSLYPACIVGVGMVARGEIGYLISALAESKGIFGRSEDGQPSELFLIITWAITLCTIIGPISVGLIVNRVRQLESGSQKVRDESKRNVLGAWGVS
ncbi:hypothetical protein FAVG1_06224 [Fusarium avenaceum]|nr:hypothetical protein FAVG1_06224 [Fusarium avenaceum]